MQRVWELLSAKGDDRSARFVCALALAQPDGSVDVFEGEARGTDRVAAARGEGLRLRPDLRSRRGSTRTFGEMTHEEKLPLTHRARAFEKLVASLK
jgi:XTP/dITP diphosphohydrolase